MTVYDERNQRGRRHCWGKPEEKGADDFVGPSPLLEIGRSYTADAFSVTTRTVLSTTCKNPPSTLNR